MTSDLKPDVYSKSLIETKTIPRNPRKDQPIIPTLPFAGDVIFCTGNSLIKSAQSLPAFSNRKKTHVAIMVSPTEIAEGMYKKEIEVVPFDKWLEGRRSQNKEEEHFILRSQSAMKKTLDIQRRVAFYLEEPYEFRSALNWDESGGSICTTFATKVLSTSCTITEPRGKDIVLPGRLYKYLLQNGFKHVRSEEFFEGAKLESGQSFYQSTKRLNEILDDIVIEITATQRDMVGWFSVIEKDFRIDPFTVMATFHDIAGENVYSFGNALANTCQVLIGSISLLTRRGPHNWKEKFSVHESKIDLLNKLASEHYALIKAFDKYFSQDHLNNYKGIKPIKIDKKIYTNIVQYLRLTTMASATIGAILNTT